MILENVNIYTEEQKFVPGRLVVEGDRIAYLDLKVGMGVGPLKAGFYTDQKKAEVSGQNIDRSEEEILDGKGAYAVPGLIDLHFHGCMGADICDGTLEALKQMAAYEVSVGVTAIAPATMTLPVEQLLHILRTAAQYKQEQDEKSAARGSACIGGEKFSTMRNAACIGVENHTATDGADLVGINMEGPFISPRKRGAQEASYILSCDTKQAHQFLEASQGLVKFIGIAPEESQNALDFIREMKKETNISLAHTNASYEVALAAYQAGANHATHLYNAMPAFAHRAPGVIGAVHDCPWVMAELICDGVHVHPAVVRATFDMLGKDRIILISDSMRATGMPDGMYTLGGQKVCAQGNRATLVRDGSLAGSVTNLADCLRVTVQEMGIPLETAIAAATINPAKCLGIDDTYGSLSPGKKADIILLGPNLSLIEVIKDGKRLARSY